MEFSSYENLKGKVQTNQITIDKLHSLIKNNPNADNIQEARNGNLDLDIIKSCLPIITPHGIFKSGQKQNDKLINLTGYLFIDVDKFKGDINALKNRLISRPEIVSCWLSVSAKGIHALACVNGLNKDNFRQVHIAYLESLEKSLDITCDRKVCTISSGLVISSDSDLLVNPEVVPLDANEFASRIKSKVTTIEATEEVLLDDLEKIRDIRYEMTLENYSNNVEYIKEGKPYYKCFIPFDKISGKPIKIREGNRYNVVSSNLNNFICLNTNASYDLCLTHANRINQFCEIPLSKDRIITLTKSLHSKSKSLKPISIKLKYYWIDPKANNKLELFHNFRKEYSINLIEEFFSDEIMNIKSKISTNIISKFTNLSAPTIDKFLTTEMKEIIQIHNKEILLNKPKRRRY